MNLNYEEWIIIVSFLNVDDVLNLYHSNLLPFLDNHLFHFFTKTCEDHKVWKLFSVMQKCCFTRKRPLSFHCIRLLPDITFSQLQNIERLCNSIRFKKTMFKKGIHAASVELCLAISDTFENRLLQLQDECSLKTEESRINLSYLRNFEVRFGYPDIAFLGALTLQQDPFKLVRKTSLKLGQQLLHISVPSRIAFYSELFTLSTKQQKRLCKAINETNFFSKLPQSFTVKPAYSLFARIAHLKPSVLHNFTYNCGNNSHWTLLLLVRALEERSEDFKSKYDDYIFCHQLKCHDLISRICESMTDVQIKHRFSFVPHNNKYHKCKFFINSLLCEDEVVQPSYFRHGSDLSPQQYDALSKTVYYPCHDITKVAMDFVHYFNLTPSEIITKLTELSENANHRYEHFMFLKSLYFSKPISKRLCDFVKIQLFKIFH